MQYAISDIHGCYDKYIELLRRINLKATDTLYILGDMIDRGPDGLKILLNISMCPNIVPFLGNHEYAALTCLPWLMEELTEENTEPDKLLWRLKSIQGWMADGGDKTVEEFRRLSPEARQDVLDLLEDLTVYEEVEAGGREFIERQGFIEHHGEVEVGHSLIDDGEVFQPGPAAIDDNVVALVAPTRVALVMDNLHVLISKPLAKRPVAVGGNGCDAMTGPGIN